MPRVVAVAGRAVVGLAVAGLLRLGLSLPFPDPLCCYPANRRVCTRDAGGSSGFFLGGGAFSGLSFGLDMLTYMQSRHICSDIYAVTVSAWVVVVGLLLCTQNVLSSLMETNACCTRMGTRVDTQRETHRDTHLELDWLASEKMFCSEWRVLSFVDTCVSNFLFS